MVAGILLFSTGISLPAMAARVAGHVTVVAANGEDRAARDARVVVWLKPAAPGAELQPAGWTPAPHARLVQRNKTFDPHVVAVEVGSLVEFPNRDPFFHNVFSLFNGKRFDLGLYEAGSTRSVHFDRAGICYIFCNIHPQMSAVVVVVDTPFFAVSDEKGDIAIPNVPAGEYQLSVWEEQCTPQVLKELSRKVVVAEGGTSLGAIQLRESLEPTTAHLNKYGRQYDPQVFSSPVYVQP
jgi:plastocyanin